MLVTITTDASFFAGYKIGAYAFWIASNEGRTAHADSFKGEVSTSDEAEMKCIVNSLHHLAKQKWTITDIIINTDNTSCISLVQSVKPSKWGNELRVLFHAAVAKLEISGTVTMKHVKGHKHKRTPRHWVNDWCDKEAKKKARKKIREIDLAKQK